MTDRFETDPAQVLDDETLAKAALRSVMLDKAAPAAAKAQAARTMLELLGSLGRHAKPPVDESRSLAEMTPDELRRELAKNQG